jgi:hypothetical protein
MPESLWRRIALTLDMIKFAHSIFALPFALLATVMAAGGFPPLGKLLWIVAACVFARSAAMSFNRLHDEPFDRRNPRTRKWALPAGLLSRRFVWGFLAVNVAGFILSAAMLNPLALALSHGAKLLILDDPTSGLDAVSRDEILELFQELIEDGERSILFSTQITSDLEKCADYITYIKNGEIVASAEKDEFVDTYKIVKGTNQQLTPELRSLLIGYKEHAYGFTGLLPTARLAEVRDLEIAPADIESIMIYFEREQKK